MNASTHFDWHGTPVRYFDHGYNDTSRNERRVELAVARKWLHRAAQRSGFITPGLEVGNVLHHYGCPFERRVVDLFDVDELVDNIDVCDIDGAYDWIVSISTVEHVGVNDDTNDPARALAAIKHLQSLLKPDGHMLITAAVGWNVELDSALSRNEIGCTRAVTYTRDVLGDHNVWLPRSTFTWLPYGTIAGWASAVWIGEW